MSDGIDLSGLVRMVPWHERPPVPVHEWTVVKEYATCYECGGRTKYWTASNGPISTTFDTKKDALAYVARKEGES